MAAACIIVAIHGAERRDAELHGLRLRLREWNVEARVEGRVSARVFGQAAVVLVVCGEPEDPEAVLAVATELRGGDADKIIPVVISPTPIAAVPVALQDCTALVLPERLAELVQRVRARVVEPVTLLTDLLLELFTPAMLRIWLAGGPEGSAVTADLPEGSAGQRELTAAGIASMRRRGIIGPALFDRLASEFPMRRAEIERIGRVLAARPLQPARGGSRFAGNGLVVGFATVVVLAALVLGVGVRLSCINLREVINQGSLNVSGGSVGAANSFVGVANTPTLDCRESSAILDRTEPKPLSMVVVPLQTRDAGDGVRAAVALAHAARAYRDAALTPNAETTVLRVGCERTEVASEEDARELAASRSADIVVWGEIHENPTTDHSVDHDFDLRSIVVEKGGALDFRAVRLPPRYDIEVHVTPADRSLAGTRATYSIDHVTMLEESRDALFEPVVLPVFAAEFERRGWGWIPAAAVTRARATQPDLCKVRGQPGEHFARALFYGGDMAGAHACAEQTRASLRGTSVEVDTHLRATLRLIDAFKGDALALQELSDATLDSTLPAAMRRAGLAANFGGDRDEAARRFADALAGLSAHGATEHPLRGLLLRDLALLAAADGDQARADRQLHGAYGLLVRTLGRAHPYTLVVHDELGRLDHEHLLNDSRPRLLPWPE